MFSFSLPCVLGLTLSVVLVSIFFVFLQRLPERLQE